MSVYRIHIRPKGGKAIRRPRYCIKEQVLGLGWQTNSHVSGVCWDDYEKEAASIHGADQLSREIVQVKTGDTPLDALDWKGRKERVILFQASGNYKNKGIENVECLEPEAMEDFVYSNPQLMPEYIAH